MAQLVDTSRSAQPQQPSYSSEARLRKEAETGWYKGEDKRPASRARTARPPPGAGEGAAGLASVPSPEAGGAARRHLQEAPAPADAGAGATEALVRRLVAEELGGLRQQVRALEEEVQALRRQLQPSPPPPR